MLEVTPGPDSYHHHINRKNKNQEAKNASNQQQQTQPKCRLDLRQIVTFESVLEVEPEPRRYANRAVPELVPAVVKWQARNFQRFFFSIQNAAP